MLRRHDDARFGVSPALLLVDLDDSGSNRSVIRSRRDTGVKKILATTTSYSRLAVRTPTKQQSIARHGSLTHMARLCAVEVSPCCRGISRASDEPRPAAPTKVMIIIISLSMLGAWPPANPVLDLHRGCIRKSAHDRVNVVT